MAFVFAGTTIKKMPEINFDTENNDITFRDVYGVLQVVEAPKPLSFSLSGIATASEIVLFSANRTAVIALTTLDITINSTFYVELQSARDIITKVLEGDEVLYRYSLNCREVTPA